MTSFRAQVGLAFSGRIVRIAVRTSLIVGTVLNVVNHGEVLIGIISPGHVPKLLLNYMVPYAVATYSAVAATRSSSSRDVHGGG